MKNRDKTLAVPVMRTYYKVTHNKNRATNGTEKSLRDRPVYPWKPYMRKRVLGFSGGKHGCFWR